MEYHTLPRRQLQTLCKKHGIPANATNLEMADALSALLKPKPDTTKQSVKSTTRNREPVVNTTVSKVKYLESSEIQVQNALGSDEKSSIKPQRATRSRGCMAEAPVSANLNTENSKNGEVESTSAAQKQGTKSVSTRRRAGLQGEDRLQSKTGEIASTKVVSPSSEKKKDRAGGIVLRRGRVKVRSPRILSGTSESDKCLEALKVNAEGNEATQGESVMPRNQSCLLDTQKIHVRKNKRFVTFSDVLEVTRSFSESPSAEVLTESRINFTGLGADQKNPSEDKKVEGSRNGSRRASRKDCIQGITTFQATQQKSRKVQGVEASEDRDILTVSKQRNGDFKMTEGDTLVSFHVEKTMLKDGRSESRCRRRSICSGKVANEAALALNEKEKVAYNCLKVDLCEEVPPAVSNTRQSRRLTLIASDFNITQDKGKSVAVNEEEKVVDSSVKGILDTVSVSSTRRSRRSTLVASDVNINQVKAKIAGNLQENSNDDHEGSNLIALKETEGDPHAEVSLRGRRRTLAPLELNHIQMKNNGEQMVKTTTLEKNKSEEHALDLGTESHNPPQKHSKAKTSARLPVPTEAESNPIKHDEVHGNGNVRCSRKNNSPGPVVPSSIGKKNNSSMEKVSDRVARTVRKPGAQKTVRETQPEAGPAKSMPSCCEAEAQEEAFKGEEVEITAIPSIIQGTVELLSGSNGPEEGGMQYCRSIQGDLNDLDKAAAKSSKEYEDPSSKACSEDSSKSFVQDTVNTKGVDPVNLPSNNNINSTKSSETLFPTTGNKLGQSSAEGANISSCDTGLDRILQAMDAGSSSVTVAKNASCDSDADISTLAVDSEFSTEVTFEPECLEITKEDDLLFDSAFNCAHQVLVDCTQKDCAASKSSPMSESRGSTLPALAKMSSNESVKEGKQILRSRLLVLSRVNSDEGPEAEDGNKHTSDSLRSTSPISTRMTSMSLVEVIEQANQYTNDIEVKDSLSIEADEVVPQGVPVGSMESQHISEEGNKHISESLGSTSPISTRMTSDEGIIDNKEAPGSTSPVLPKMSPAEGNLGGIPFTIDNEVCAIDASITRADKESSSPSSLSMSSAEVTEQGNQYTSDIVVKDSLSIEVDAVVPVRLPAGSIESPFRQHNTVETCSPKQEMRSDMSPLLTRTASEEGIIDSKETQESSSPVSANVSPAEGNLDGDQIKVHATENSVSLRSDIESSSTYSDEATEQCIQYTSNVVVDNSLDIDADAVVKDGLPSCNMKSPFRHQVALEPCAPVQEMCSDNELLILHENECVGSSSTEDVEYNLRSDQAVDFNLCKVVRAREEQEFNCQCDFVDVIQVTNEGAPSEVADFEPADCLQVISEEVQFDRASMVVDSTTTDGQVGPIPSSCVEAPGQSLPMEVADIRKQRRPRAIYKSARKPKPSVLQEIRSFTEMGFGSSGKGGRFMPWDQKHVEVQGYSTPNMGSDGVDSLSPEESEEGDSEDMEDSFSDGEFCKFNSDVLPHEDVSCSEETTYSDSGEDAAFDSEEECFEEEEEVLSGAESYESEEVDISEEELSESDEDDSVDDTGSLDDHESTPALHSVVKLKSSKASSCSGHFLEATEVEHNAAYEIALPDFAAAQSELLSNDHSSVDEHLATHITCQNDTVLTSLSSLFETPLSKIKEDVNCSLSTDYKEAALAESGQQSMDKAESCPEFCESLSTLEMEQEEDGDVLDVVQRGSEGFSYTDQAVNNGVYQALELTLDVNDCVNKEVTTEDAGAETPDTCVEVCSEALNEDLEAVKNHSDTCTSTVQDGVASDEQTEEYFGVGAANLELATTSAVDCDMNSSEYHLSTGDLLQDVKYNSENDTTDMVVGSAMAPLALLEPGKEETVSVDPEVVELCATITCTLVEKAESIFGQGENQPELLLSDTFVLNEAQACENQLSEVTKEPSAAEISTMEISREQSLQQIDLTLMSLRKLKQLCKENEVPATTKPVTETPSRRPINAWMSAKKANTAAQPRDLPSANKRSVLKVLSSNIKSNTPAASTRTPTAKSMQRPRNLMSTYEDNEGAGKNLVAPSPRAPPSSKREFARQI